MRRLRRLFRALVGAPHIRGPRTTTAIEPHRARVPRPYTASHIVWFRVHPAPWGGNSPPRTHALRRSPANIPTAAAPADGSAPFTNAVIDSTCPLPHAHTVS